MAPPLLKHQKSTLLNQLSKSDGAPSTQALPLPKCSGAQTIPQPTASPDRNIPQHQRGTFEVSKRCIEAIIFRKTAWPIFFGDKYSMVEDARKLVIEAQNRRRALVEASVGMLSMCQLPGGASLKIDLHTQEAVSLGFCLMLLYQISNIAYDPKYT